MPSKRSVHSHSFSEVPRAQIPRSSFDRSHGHKGTYAEAGRLYPIYVDEALPGDTFNMRTSGFMRLATPIFPIMDNMYMDTFYFAVPIRLVWDNWQKMMGEQEAPGDSTDYLVPQVDTAAQSYNIDTIADHMGIPTGRPDVEHSALFVRAYNLIWNEWFRDQNLQNPVNVPKGDGPDAFNLANGVCLRRGKRHDYFTSALPWPQKGEAVTLPVATSAPIIPTENNLPSFFNEGNPQPTGTWLYNRTGEGFNVSTTSGTNQSMDVLKWNDPSLEVDLQNTTAATINQMREAFQVQKMLERDARGGTRYTEVVRNHFGVTSPDARLQRPEFLGGGTQRVNISPIHATAESGAAGVERELGSLSGIGTVAFRGHGFVKSFTEHCILIGLMCVRADQTYHKGLNRMWSRRDRLDFYWPALSHLGEQEVLNKEIWLWGDNDPTDNDVWGYQERYAEYRYKPSQICGKFRSGVNDSLDAWHLAQDHGILPGLNGEFIKEDPPLDRCIAVPSEPHFIGDFWHRLICARPMPLFGVPGNIDRF